MNCFLSLSYAFGLFVTLLTASQQRPLPTNDAALAPNAPIDRPVAATLSAFERRIAPAVRQGRATLPQAKRRFLNGLPTGQVFFVTTRISDGKGQLEQVFVRVKQWQNQQLSGLIASKLGVVKSYRLNQLITFPESAVLDWTISRPDGTEEGNYIGKLLDADKR